MGDAARRPPAVEVTRLTRHHRGSGGVVLANDEISFQVEEGEVFGLLGPNGAGKTTLVRQLAGVLAPDSGRIALLGNDLGGQPRLAPHLLAYLAQEEPALRDLPVRTAVETTARLRGVPRRTARAVGEAVLDELALGGLAEQPLGRLSGGQRRLAEVACALVGERPLLVLDEPTTGLDPIARRTVWDAVRRRTAAHATVVLVTHNVLEAETVLDRVAVLEAGRLIACDTPGRLKAMVGEDVRLDLVWRGDAPTGDRTVALLAACAVVTGRRWSCRLPQEQARRALAELTTGPVFAALDDFTLATPSLEDVYLQLGGRQRDLERT